MFPSIRSASTVVSRVLSADRLPRLRGPNGVPSTPLDHNNRGLHSKMR